MRKRLIACPWMISPQLLGTREVVFIHHTNCGMLTCTDPHLHQKLHMHADMPFLSCDDLEKSVRDDLEMIRTSPPRPPVASSTTQAE